MTDIIMNLAIDQVWATMMMTYYATSYNCLYLIVDLSTIITQLHNSQDINR